MPALTIMIKPVSGRCDMRCRYCFYADEMRCRAGEKPAVMREDILEKAVRRVLRCAEGSAGFYFQGGEPTLAGVGFFESVLRFEKQYAPPRLRVTNAIQTNALHLTEDMIAFLARSGFLVGVSLDGSAALHDRYRRDARGGETWSRVKENLDLMLAAGAEANVLCVLTQDAALQPEAVFEALSPYRYLQFIPCLDPLNGERQPWSLTPEAYAHFLTVTFGLYERAYLQGKAVSIRTFDNWLAVLLGQEPENCAMTGRCGTSLMMESDGTLYPCDFYGTDEWALGNIRDTSLRGILQSEKERAFLTASLPVPPQCRECRWGFLCRNGCRRERGKDGVSRWCEALRAFFPAAYPRMLKLTERIR